MFSLLRGIGRARDCWLYIVVDWTFTSRGGENCVYTYSWIIAAQVVFARLILAVGRDRKIVLTAKFPDLR